MNHDIPTSGDISTLNANVECDLGGSYTVDVTVTSGSSGTGQAAASLTANTPQVVAITISPSVTITGTTFNADIVVIK